MQVIGFELWSNNERLANAAGSAGIDCEWIGGGLPTQFPEPGHKTYDVAVVEANRWALLARTVAAKLNGVSILRIPEVDNEELLRLLGQARILIWPSRVEGHSRIQSEARVMGTVPVALPNPFAVGLSTEEGAMVVSSLEEMPAAIEGLLADPVKLGKLAALGVRTARNQLDWEGPALRAGIGA
jgi:glycosyltransferase involved in cell wall biosynthesis